MIKKIKIKKDPQRLKHSVRFDIEFFLDPKEKKVKKLLIVFVQKGGIADKKFLIGDVIKSVNGVTVTNRIELDNEVNKVDWGDEVDYSWGACIFEFCFILHHGTGRITKMPQKPPPPSTIREVGPKK